MTKIYNVVDLERQIEGSQNSGQPSDSSNGAVPRESVGRDADSAETGSEGGVRKPPVKRLVLQLAAAFVLCWVSYGTDLADGIIYSRLILPPCLTNVSADGNLTANSTIPPSLFSDSTASPSPTQISVSSSLTFSPGDADNVTNSTESQECGGFGRGASQTGTQLISQ